MVVFGIEFFKYVFVMGWFDNWLDDKNFFIVRLYVYSLIYILRGNF